MADFRMPLEPVDMFFLQCDRLATADEGTGNQGKIRRRRGHFIRMGCPDPDYFRITFEDIIMLAYFPVNRTISPRGTLADFPPECRCDDMETKSDPQHRKP